MKKTLIFAASALALTACNQSAEPNAEMQQLMDRIAIEDMVVDYYSHLGKDDDDAFTRYFTEDAVFEVNGIVANGRDEIRAIYEATGGEDEEQEGDEELGPLFHMMLTNAVINVDGDAATASFIWTGVENASLSEHPEITEQGREYDRLVREDGVWKFSHRIVIADSALPDAHRATYNAQREFSFD